MERPAAVTLQRAALMAAVSREAEAPVALQAQVVLQAQVALQAQVGAARPSTARSIMSSASSSFISISTME